MKKLLVLTSLVILLTFTVLLMPQNPALANWLDKITMPIDDTFPVDNSEAQCGFVITEHQYGQIKAMAHFDDEGNFLGYHLIYGQMNAVWSAHGKTAKLQPYGPLSYQVRPDGDNWWVSLGAAHILTLPGYGYVGGYAGQESYLYDGETWEVIKEKKAGHFDIFNWEAICSYFE